MPPEVLQSRPKRDRHDHTTAKGQVTVDQSCRHRRTRDDNARVQVESTPIRVALQQGRFILAPQTKAPQIRNGSPAPASAHLDGRTIFARLCQL